MTDETIRLEDLLAYAAGELSADQTRRVEAHLADDPGAAATVSRYRIARQRMADHDAFEPPPAAAAAARAIFDRPPRPTWLDRVDAVVGSLLFDSRVQAAPVRYAGTDGHLQLAFETEGTEIDLTADRDVADGTARWHVMGQVTGTIETGSLQVTVRLGGDEEPFARIAGDDRDRFAVDLPAGRYDLLLEHAGGAVVLLDVQIE